MAQKVVNKALGLYSFKNNLTVPDGAMEKADNVVIDKDDIIESRRGFGLHSTISGTSADRAKQLLQYKDRLLVHFGTTLSFEEADGSFTAFDGTYTELESGLRIKGIENSGNYYFTTAEGVKKISATNSSEYSSGAGYITDAGAVKALGFDYSIVYSDGDWLQVQDGVNDTPSIVSYVVMWGYRDKNSNLILGEPSDSVTVINKSTSAAHVELDITIPSEIDIENPLGYFVQVYRSSVKVYDSVLNTAPDTERKLVAEEIPTSGIGGQIEAKLITVTDQLPEAFRATAPSAYTNETSGEGILQANTRPPRCKDIEYFKGSTFYSNTTTRHFKELLYSSTNGMISGNTKLIIASESGTPTEYTYVGIQQETKFDLDLYVAAFDKAHFANTLLKINADEDIATYTFWFDTTGSDTAPILVGEVPIVVDISSALNKTDVLNAIKDVIDFEPLSDNIAHGTFESTNTPGAFLDIRNKYSGRSAVSSVSLPTGATFTSTVDGAGEDISAQIILLPVGNGFTPGTSIVALADSTARVVSANADEIVTAVSTAESTGIQGGVTFQSKNASDTAFMFAINESGVENSFTPVLPLSRTTSGNNADINLLNPNVLEITHGLDLPTLGYAKDDLVRLYDKTGSLNSEVLGYHIIASVDYSTPGSEFFTVNLPTAVTIAETGDISFFKMSAISENETKPNRIYYSKNGIPEAVPILNYFDAGSKDKPIDRIIALRDSLFILKQDGVYRLSGNDSSNFNVVLFDNSSPIIAPDSASVLNNKIYALTTQGVAEISDGGVQVVSRNIEDAILNPTSNNFPNFSTQCFGMSSENDRAYFLHLPTETDDTASTQCFRYNVFTSAWTRWDITKTCGIVKDDDDKIYFGASDINYIEQERKNFLRSDYADRQYASTIFNQIDNLNLEMGSITNIEKFDAIYQEQYITIARFNQLLSTLDNDPFLPVKIAELANDPTPPVSYTAQFNAAVGADLSTLISSLITRIQADDTSPAVYTASSGTNNAETLRDDFNILTAELNVSLGVFLLDYKTYTSLVRYEDTISKVTGVGNIITLTVTTPFVVGDVTIFKAIPCSIEYAPENLGDTSLMKHFREATIMFDEYAFTFGEIGFRSDLSASLELQIFPGDGNGDYGTPDYGDSIYGGNSNSRPIRTYVPRNKQRARFITVAFNHDAARENFEITGYSVTYSGSTTERAYKN